MTVEQVAKIIAERDKLREEAETFAGKQHGLQVELAKALRDFIILAAGCKELTAERDSLRAERDALGSQLRNELDAAKERAPLPETDA